MTRQHQSRLMTAANAIWIVMVVSTMLRINAAMDRPHDGTTSTMIRRDMMQHESSASASSSSHLFQETTRYNDNDGDVPNRQLQKSRKAQNLNNARTPMVRKIFIT
jgi:hypothetical protein